MKCEKAVPPNGAFVMSKAIAIPALTNIELIVTIVTIVSSIIKDIQYNSNNTIIQ